MLPGFINVIVAGVKGVLSKTESEGCVIASQDIEWRARMKKIDIKWVAISAGILFITSCAHHRDVRPGVNGQNRVVTTATEGEDAARAAIKQANHYCEQFKKMPKIVSEKTTYTGEMDEDTRKTLRKASEAAILVGGMNLSDTQQVNPVLGAGQVGSVMTSGEDYRTEMVFGCE